jgi:hypothetical protein
VASDATEFAAEVADALEQAHDADTGRRRVMGETWGAKAEAVLNALRDSGIVPAGVEVDSNVDR